MTIKSISFLCALLGVSPTLAAAGKVDRPQDDEPKADRGSEQKLEEKPRGKFSLLGWECKAEEEGGVETTPGSPPLDVDDAGTPGCNGWEVNVVTSGEFGKSMNLETPLLDINYGVGDNLQLKYEIPYLLSRIDGASKSGVGSAEFGIKYRFYEDDESGTSMAVYPQFEFAIPGTAAAEDGGTLTKLPVLFSTKVGEISKGDVMITANAGYNVSTDPATKNYASAAFGVGFPLTKQIAMMAEGSTEQAIDENMDDAREALYKANLGFLGRINDNLLLFGAVGQSYASADVDDASHTCVLLGLRLIAGGP